MGRTKMKIERIETERKRTNCFNKRQPGLLKKAMELSILCDARVTVFIVGEKGQTFGYSTEPLAQAVGRFTASGTRLLNNADYGSSFQKSGGKMALSDDDGGDDGDEVSGEGAPKGDAALRLCVRFRCSVGLVRWRCSAQRRDAHGEAQSQS